MPFPTKRQLSVFAIFLLIYALTAILTYLTMPADQYSAAMGGTNPAARMPVWQIALVAAGVILVAYGLLGLAGFWFARHLDLPAIYRSAAGWRSLLVWPLLTGLGLGIVLIAGDRLFALFGKFPGFPHPSFPLSIVASAAAGIGEEILFRSFVLGLWAFLLNLVLRHWKATAVALWIGNIIAALAFSASHLPSAMYLLGYTSPAQIPPYILAEIFVLNSLMGLVAGRAYVRNGLVAAIGIHFWADVVWHVIWPLL